MSVPTSLVGGDRVEEAYRNTVTAMWEMVQPESSWRLAFYNAGDPGRVLVAESADAVLLVIGTREHVGWGRILNGSISHYCLSHAVCPVVAVPPAATRVYESEPRLRADAGHADSSTA
jgi:hypothetical protein